MKLLPFYLQDIEKQSIIEEAVLGGKFIKTIDIMYILLIK